MAASLSRPVIIFAGGLGEARAFAEREKLSARSWVFVRDPAQARYLQSDSVAVLPGFPHNPRYLELSDLSAVLESESRPYVSIHLT